MQIDRKIEIASLTTNGSQAGNLCFYFCPKAVGFSVLTDYRCMKAIETGAV